MPKRNRDKLIKQDLYDMLCMINNNLMKFGSGCAIIAVAGYEEKSNRCNEYKCKCDKCLQEWLNEYPN